MTTSGLGGRAVGRTGYVLTVSKLAGVGPVIEAIPEFQYKPEYTRSLVALRNSTGPVNTVVTFSSAGEEKVVRVGDNRIICMPCAVWMVFLLKKRWDGVKECLLDADKRELFCTVELEEGSQEWANMQARHGPFCRQGMGHFAGSNRCELSSITSGVLSPSGTCDAIWGKKWRCTMPGGKMGG
eukprot:jgi/Botrbrau1/12407/Bobra.0229s0005.1